jgi:hypothetical protein
LRLHQYLTKIILVSGMGDLIGRSFIYHGFKILQPLGNEFYTTKAKNGVLMTADDSTIQISDIIINT